jgi:hypothetical protein
MKLVQEYARDGGMYVQLDWNNLERWPVGKTSADPIERFERLCTLGRKGPD